MLLRKSFAAWMLGLACACLTGCGGVSIVAVFTDDQAQPVPFQEIAATANSSVGERRLVVIRDLVAWDALWSEHVAHQSLPQARPAVNFAQEMVIGIFLGTRTTRCASVSVHSIWQADHPDRLEVVFSETALTPSAACSSVIGSAASFIVVPYSLLPVDFIQKW